MSGTTSGVLFTPNGAMTDLTIYRGKSLRFEVIWGGSTPLDITGYTATFQARSYAGRLMLELSTVNGRVSNGGADGRLTFVAPPAATAGVDAAGTYELELATPTGDVYRVISGRVTIEEETVL
ncbi:MAG: hypothetical protein R3D68_00240 [Hyphomicrobiaceae bacterium]